MPTKNKDLRFEMRVSPAFMQVIQYMQQDPNWKFYNRSQIIDRLVAQQGIKMGIPDIYSRITQGEDWREKIEKFNLDKE